MKLKEAIKSFLPLVLVLIGLLLLRTYVFTPVVVRGDSMDPTLINSERVIALKNHDIKRFDIITFPAPDDEGKNYIKRVIGLPGDTVEYRDDTLYINGKAYKEPYLQEYKDELTDGAPLTGDFTLEEVIGTTKVPEGEVFVLGDNRRISKDSRMIGAIEESKVMGNVKFVFWPISRFGTID